MLQVYATIPAALIATAGSATIITHNPFSGAGNNGLSNPLTFTINPVVAPNPTPLLLSISPTNTTLTTPAASLTLTLNGSDFVVPSNGAPGAFVCWNPTTTSIAGSGTSCPKGTTMLSVAPMTTPSSTQIVVTVPASLLGAAGTASVFVINPPNTSGTPPAGGGGQSGPLAFNIFAANPVPVLTSISPTNTTAGSMAFTLAVTGSSFVTNLDPTQAAMVIWTNSNGTTQLLALGTPTPSTTQFSVTVPASLIATQGTATVYVRNPPVFGATPPGGGGGNSSPQVFTIGPATAIVKAAAEETPAVSADGRYVAYTATQGQFAAIFFRDTCAGAATSCQPQTSLVSVSADGDAANEDSHTPSMSADGRYVAFASAATNLLSATPVAGETIVVPGPGRQIYLRDTCTGAPSGCVPSTQLVSTDPSGQLVGTEGILPSVSASGRFVAFVAVTGSKSPGATASSAATQNNSASASGYRQVFVRDTCLGASTCTAKTTRISLQPGDGSESAPATTTPAGPALSGDAKKIALSGGGTAVLFMQSVAVDDRLFVAALGQAR